MIIIIPNSYEGVSDETTEDHLENFENLVEIALEKEYGESTSVYFRPDQDVTIEDFDADWDDKNSEASQIGQDGDAKCIKYEKDYKETIENIENIIGKIWEDGEWTA